MKNPCIPNAKTNLNTKLNPFEDFHLYTLDVKSVKTTKQNKTKTTPSNQTKNSQH